ncbi:hypothetical protein EOD41_19020 [Mucilaginibacter limnophilus]|uniref:Lipocalin-like domain-containing protein n=1 Tax=Mucilaginibacter limnophilus TaxID=1932778 RepID=A0A437MHX3_9SPHI|nr:hypothetical protein [Mucilaginibacter limnophilus]RVT97258.1 hypothetical protein EOD41_19020 [Mucilaginibacter limnophilus]
MKNLILILILFVIVACSKQILNSNSSVYNGQLDGKWNWRRSTGGFAGQTITQETLRYTMGIRFAADSVYMLRNDSIKDRDQYTISRGKSIISPDSVNIIQYNAGHINQVIVSVTADTLVLADNVNDGYTSVYVRDK